MRLDVNIAQIEIRRQLSTTVHGLCSLVILLLLILMLWLRALDCTTLTTRELFFQLIHHSSLLLHTTDAPS
jgi:hypothetical protein